MAEPHNSQENKNDSETSSNVAYGDHELPSTVLTALSGDAADSAHGTNNNPADADWFAAATSPTPGDVEYAEARAAEQTNGAASPASPDGNEHRLHRPMRFWGIAETIFKNIHGPNVGWADLIWFFSSLGYSLNQSRSGSRVDFSHDEDRCPFPTWETWQDPTTRETHESNVLFIFHRPHPFSTIKPKKILSIRNRLERAGVNMALLQSVFRE
ncbi:uncharacterized protein J7T54_007633 [Emericellopsis cladophorae]|uniref:Uncharacterized protein n=1 Tax=Emericellopsis cladophorae TaxID=2686198 RepID=A0A9P9XVP6_9HYPO|nr:uncharacterized protein J7T54_007633 [Emericellopsis cladophorae]KAI6778692.1 hypothetical protein J7T54_007633 [Emericellopsis cladophorae]